jgi:hypothetical protein
MDIGCWAESDSDARPQDGYAASPLAVLMLFGRVIYVRSVGDPSAECPHCHMTVTARERRVVDDACVYHFSCYEAWHVGKFGKLPRLRLTAAADKRYQATRLRSSP